MKLYQQITVLILIFLTNHVVSASPQRWFTPQQVTQGKAIFKQNCASCHGQNAEATFNWKQTDANGKYPPPPLNGTGHAWHHDLDLLKRTIREGGQKLGGVMPPFESKLGAGEIELAIAYFQSKWPDELYDKWSGRFSSNENLPSLTDIVDARKSQVTRLLKQRFRAANFTEPEKTAIDDVWQVKLKNQHIYLIENGNYALIGDLIDLKTGRNLTDLDRRLSTIEAIASYTDNDKIIYPAVGNEKDAITIFTDTSCPFCRKLHQEIAQLQKAGIKVSYLPFARGGTSGPGYQTLKSVWCAKDRPQALTDAKNEQTTDLPEGNCEQASIIDKAYKTGNDIGIKGTPAIFKSDGKQVQGYVPYKELIPMILGM